MIRITNKENCTGCHACVNICPQECIFMKADDEGFLYPYVNNNRCIDCGSCESVCPIANIAANNNKAKVYACINKDESIRLDSSSGGIFTLIAEQILLNGGIVFGVIFNEDFSAIHSCAETREELEKMRGSKYVQSEIGKTYRKAKDFLDEGRQVLFSGTPCQIAGLNSFLGKVYNKLFTVDIICHGVPSPAVWHEYIAYREKNAGERIKKIAFRRKDEGWKLFSLSFLFQSDKEYIQTLNKDLYMKAFLKNICLRPSCYSCKFKTLNRQSDITLADFWGVQNIMPEMDDDKGTSLILVNSTKGQDIFEKIKNEIKYKETDIGRAVTYNTSAVKSVAYNPKREKFFEELGELSFDKLVKKYCSDSINIRVKRSTKAVIRSALQKTGLLNVVKKSYKA